MHLHNRDVWQINLCISKIIMLVSQLIWQRHQIKLNAWLKARFLTYASYPEVSGAEWCPASGRRAVWSSVVLYGLIWVTGVSQAGHMLAWRWFLQSWALSFCWSLWKPAGVYEALWRQTAAQDCIHCAADPRLSSWDPSSGRFYSCPSWRAEDEAPSHVRTPASPAGQMSYWGWGSKWQKG